MVLLNCAVIQNVVIKVGELVLQIALLVQCLENSYPVRLLYLLTAIVCLD